MLKNMLLQINAKHNEETNILREEMDKLKDKVVKLEKEVESLSTNEKSDVDIEHIEKEKPNEKDTANAENSEKWYNCNMCDYRVQKNNHP